MEQPGDGKANGRLGVGVAPELVNVIGDAVGFSKKAPSPGFSVRFGDQTPPLNTADGSKTCPAWFHLVILLPAGTPGYKLFNVLPPALVLLHWLAIIEKPGGAVIA
jgi:hypothetical protein